MRETVKALLRPSLSKFIWLSLLVCVAGWYGTERQQTQARTALEQARQLEWQNLDVALGGWRERISDTFRTGAFCKPRGVVCRERDMDDGVYWSRQSISHDEILDVKILRKLEGRLGKVEIVAYLRDRNVDTTTLEPALNEALMATVQLLGIAPASLAACRQADNRWLKINDGGRTMGCVRVNYARYQDSMYRWVTGSMWQIELEVPTDG